MRLLARDRQHRPDLVTAIYLFSIILGAVPPLLDRERNISQSLFAMGLVMSVFSVVWMWDVGSYFSSPRIIKKIYRRFGVRTLLPGILLMIIGIALFKTGICPPPFWAR